MTSLYKTPVTNLNGIGEKRAALFARLGIKSVGDLINFYPRTYEDWSNIKHIDELEYGETVCIKAVVATSVNDTRISGGRIISKTAVYDETGSIQLVFLTINTSAQCSDRAENISFTENLIRQLRNADCIADFCSCCQGNTNPSDLQTNGRTSE